MSPSQAIRASRRPFDDLVDDCASTIIPLALAISGCPPMDRQLGAVLGMAETGIRNRQALRMWIRWRLEERRAPIPKSDPELETLQRRMWLDLLPTLLRIKAAADTQAEHEDPAQAQFLSQLLLMVLEAHHMPKRASVRAQTCPAREH